MTTQTVRLAAIALAAAALTGCATVTRGSHTAWQVTSEPAGAQVSTSSGLSCPSTPCAIRVSRKAAFTATVSKAGYRPVELKVAPIPAAGVHLAADALMTAPIAAAIDVATGADLDLSPNPAAVKLESAP